MDDWYDATAEESKRLKFYTQTAGHSMAYLMGLRASHTNSYDEVLALPSEDAVRVALNILQILADESSAADIIDSLRGSFVIKTLTDEMKDEIVSSLEEIKEKGDCSVWENVLKGIDDGYF